MGQGPTKMVLKSAPFSLAPQLLAGTPSHGTDPADKVIYTPSPVALPEFGFQLIEVNRDPNRMALTLGKAVGFVHIFACNPMHLEESAFGVHRNFGPLSLK